MDKIRKFLQEKGYELWDDSVIDGCNEYLRIMIFKSNSKYIIRNAILCFFDRWVNSGVEIQAESEEEVIEYFSKPEKCIKDAVMELIETITADAGYSNDYSRVEKMIGMLCDLLDDNDS